MEPVRPIADEPDTAPRDDRVDWHPLDAGWAILVGLVASIGARLAVGRVDATTAEVFGIVLPVQAVATLLAVAAIAPRRTDWREALRARARPVDLWGIPIGVGLQFALAGLAYLLVLLILEGDVPAQEVVAAASEAIGTVDRLLVAFGLIVLGPLAEEVVFRGVLLRAFEQTGSRRRAVVLSAGAFSALHLIDPNAYIAVPLLFILGLVLGAEVIRTGRLARAITIHAGFNALTVMALFAL
jgi:membrane protease YdiL (CAAX protease family)